MGNAKLSAQKVITRLPDDATLEDIQYHLYVLEKVENGLGQLSAGDGVAHEEARARLARWLAD